MMTTSALTGFELGRLVRSRQAALAAAVFALVLVAGHLPLWWGEPRQPGDHRLFVFAYLGALVLSLQLGWASDRERGFDELFAVNFVRPEAYLRAKAAALCVYLVGFGVFALAVALLVSLGEVRYALWYSTTYTLIGLLFVPLVLLVERTSDTRLPAAIALMGYAVAGVLAQALAGTPAVVRLIGLPDARTPGALLPLAWRAAAAVVFTLLVLAPLCARRLPDPARRARGRPSPPTP